MDHLGLVESVDALGQGIVTKAARATYGWLDASLGQRIDAYPSVAMVDQAALADEAAGAQGCSRASSTRSVRAEPETFQPTMRRAKTSMTKAT